MAKKTSSTKAKTTKKSPAKKTVAKAKQATAKASPSKPKNTRATEPYSPVFGAILLIVCAIMAAVLLIGAIRSIIKATESDAMRFSSEYSLVESDNVYKIKSAKEIKNILEHGTGVVFLGFPSCQWCQTYAKMLNDLAKEKGVENIYYYNIHDDRENNTETYQDFVKILSDYLQYDNVGEKRIYVPNATFVVEGEIVGNDWETSKDTLELQSPEEYWTEEREEAWREKVGKLFEKVKESKNCETTCDK